MSSRGFVVAMAKFRKGQWGEGEPYLSIDLENGVGGGGGDYSRRNTELLQREFRKVSFSYGGWKGLRIILYTGKCEICEYFEAAGYIVRMSVTAIHYHKLSTPHGGARGNLGKFREVWLKGNLLHFLISPCSEVAQPVKIFHIICGIHKSTTWSSPWTRWI
jgi:hypothetical protein